MGLFQIVIKIIVFLIGSALLVSGFVCGVTGVASAPSAGAYAGAAWFLGGVGLTAAALGALLLGLIFGLIGKKKATPPTSGENTDQAKEKPEQSG